MHGSRAVRTFHTALIALIGALFITVGATSAYAGGSDHGNGAGQQKWTSEEGQQSGGQWDSDKSQDWQSEDQTQSDDTSDDQDKDCKKEEGSTGEKTGEETPTPPQGETGGEQGGEQKGEQGGEQKGEENQGGEHGKKEEENKGGEKSQGGQTPAPVTPTTPAAVTTPAPAPVQAQQTPMGGEVQGESQESPKETGQGGSSPNRGGRVLAENETTQPTASESGLAGTGFDAWQLALLGAVCIAGSALMLRRTRRS